MTLSKKIRKKKVYKKKSSYKKKQKRNKNKLRGGAGFPDSVEEELRILIERERNGEILKSFELRRKKFLQGLLNKRNVPQPMAPASRIIREVEAASRRAAINRGASRGAPAPAAAAAPQPILLPNEVRNIIEILEGRDEIWKTEEKSMYDYNTTLYLPDAITKYRSLSDSEKNKVLSKCLELFNFMYELENSTMAGYIAQVYAMGKIVEYILHL